uniref:Uncharacterized protein n=1 Tax=Anguilla anguilla TaxID=7936 RepID=A0A0E9QZR8_ANGAN
MSFFISVCCCTARSSSVALSCARPAQVTVSHGL